MFFWNGYFHSAACTAGEPSLIIPQVQERCQNSYVPLPFQPGLESRTESGVAAWRGGGGG